jgi:hypothetical protein
MQCNEICKLTNVYQNHSRLSGANMCEIRYISLTATQRPQLCLFFLLTLTGKNYQVQALVGTVGSSQQKDGSGSESR